MRILHYYVPRFREKITDPNGTEAKLTVLCCDICCETLRETYFDRHTIETNSEA